DDHAAGMLAKMARQTVNRTIQPDECRHSRMIFWQTSSFDLRFQFHGVREIAAGKQVREPVDNARRKIERFADLTRGTAPTIRDHVRGHGCTVFAVASINFLNYRFTAIAARKIKINIRPSFASLVEKSLEYEMIFHWVDRRDPEAITNSAIGGAAAALDHDVVFTAEIDDVPNDQEIAGETELAYQCKLFLDLTLHFRADRGVTLLRTEPDDGAQKRIHGVSNRHRVFRKFVSDIFERKCEPLSQARCVLNCFRQIREHCAHFA